MSRNHIANVNGFTFSNFSFGEKILHCPQHAFLVTWVDMFASKPCSICFMNLVFIIFNLSDSFTLTFGCFIEQICKQVFYTDVDAMLTIIL